MEKHLRLCKVKLEKKNSGIKYVIKSYCNFLFSLQLNLS